MSGRGAGGQQSAAPDSGSAGAYRAGFGTIPQNGTVTSSASRPFVDNANSPANDNGVPEGWHPAKRKMAFIRERGGIVVIDVIGGFGACAKC